MKSRLLGIWHSNYARRTAPNLQKALRSDLYEGENYSVLPPPHEQRSEETRNRFNLALLKRIVTLLRVGGCISRTQN